MMVIWLVFFTASMLYLWQKAPCKDFGELLQRTAWVATLTWGSVFLLSSIGQGAE